ncbi:MAG: bi-domain-containing oxidoreductase [Candidatus Eisenbacteria bacterium]|nr:bi-domain-containing oxidoreductase [Candidatus Eisenbacteria bacterium]
MKVLAQNYSNGSLEMLEVPMIASQKGLLVKTMASVVSVGTEKAMIDVARKSLLGKALARPDWVKQVIDKVKQEGLMEAWRQSKARLDMPVPLGYSCAGIVQSVGEGEGDFRVGDRVGCSGSGHASHAEWNAVPSNLCAKIPDNVSFEDASYVAVGGIAMEAVRLARPEFGHKIGIIGLGLLGQIAVQIARAAGCHVLGIDVVDWKCELALRSGAERVAVAGKDDPIAAAREFSGHDGLDAVIILASVDSDEPLIQAARMARERGRIIAGGLVGLNVPRQLFYEKELEFAVSRAWGPGLYDLDYEERGFKYPVAYARWTAQRNMEEFLRMVSIGSIKLDCLTTQRFPFEKALQAYEMLMSGKESALGVVLQYPEKDQTRDKPVARMESPRGRIESAESGRVHADRGSGKVRVGVIGAGLFARGTLLPAMKKVPDMDFAAVTDSRGLNAKVTADLKKFRYTASDYLEILRDNDIDLVFVLTRHDSHYKLVCETLKSGKPVFVEKPLCIRGDQLREIAGTYNSLVASGSNPFLMVGFNRRFAPTTKMCIEFVKKSRDASVVQIRCNAGFISQESWVHKKDEGGGRIIGEVCHFVDLAQAITGGLPEKVFACCTESSKGLRDSLTVSMQMDNGAVAGITYASNGDKSFPREEVQVFAGDSVCVIDNFKNIEFVRSGKRRSKRSLEVDRGHVGELRAACDAIRNGRPSPIDFRSIVATTAATFAIEESITKGEAVKVSLSEWGIS